MPLDVYQPNGEWDLIDRGVEIGQRKVEGRGKIGYTSFWIKLARKPTYFILNVLIPRLVNNEKALLAKLQCKRRNPCVNFGYGGGEQNFSFSGKVQLPYVN